MKKKTLAMVMAAVLLIGGAIGATIAYLTTKTAPVENVFTTANIDITLEETKDDFKMVPGHTIEKDPVATVLAGSEKAYLFVKLAETANFDDFLTYTVADGWTLLDGHTDIYYRIVEAAETDQAFGILTDNQVKVKPDVTKEALNALTENTYPKLTLTAYATQYLKDAETAFTPAEAWANITP